MVKFELNENAVLSEREKELLEEAKKKPVVYDEDSPRLTDDMERAKEEKSCHGEPLTLYVSPETIRKVKSMGTDYMAILGKLLDKAVKEYHVS